VPLEMAMYRAYHQWMEDYCKNYPDRLGGVILISSRDIKGSVESLEIAARLKPDQAHVHYQLGRAYIAAGIIFRCRRCRPVSC